MKLASFAITVAVCSTQNLSHPSHYQIVFKENGQLQTDFFSPQLAAIWQRNWYVPNKARNNVSHVYPTQLNTLESGWDQVSYIPKEGWGLRRERMTQYKFSFIGDSKNCIIGFTHAGDLNHITAGPGLDSSNGSLVGRGFLKYLYAQNVGRDLNDVDWFIEHHKDGHVEVYITLNGEPLGMAFLISPHVIRSRQFAAKLRPLLRCRVSNTKDPKKAIAVTQYSHVRIPLVRPYAKNRKPDSLNFIIRNLQEISNVGFGNKEFQKNDFIRFKVTDRLISVICGNGTLDCDVEFRNDPLSSFKADNCSRAQRVYDPEPFHSLQSYMTHILKKADRYEWLPTGDLKLHSPVYGSQVFESLGNFVPVVDNPFL